MDSALDFGTPLPHIVLNVEQEWLLPKVGIHNLPRCLQAYGGVEVGLRRRMDVSQAPEGSRDQSHSAYFPSRKAIPKSLKGEEKEKQAKFNKEKSPVFASKVTMSPRPLAKTHSIRQDCTPLHAYK